ncbi:MAG: TlpA family protein disulfide reductase [Pyrinomonadaceae bacterium]
MCKPFLLLLLAGASALSVAPQSGRRITTPTPTHTAPIQPPANPEPEPRSVIAYPVFLFLSESLRERQIKTLDGGSFRFADFEGKILVINLWASWCGPCRREVPEYEKVRQAYAGRDVEFIALTTEDPRVASDRVHKFVRDFNFGFRLGWADREIARTLMDGNNALPHTIVIDTRWRVVNHWRGYALGRSGERLKQTIDQALEKPVP